MRARVAVLAAVTATGLAACGGGGEAAPARLTGGSTLERTLVDPDGDAVLEPGPGEPFAERTELAPARPPGRELARLGQLTDAHVADEESPARVPFLDRFGGDVTTAFRPQESLTPHVLAAAVRALNAERPQAVAVTGDTMDNVEEAELGQARAVLDGGRVEPGTGGPGYRGVQEGANPDPLYYRPDGDAPRHPGLLEAAQRPFDSPGLDAPWFAVMGNHDVLRQGELPPDARTDAVATGSRLLTTLDRDFRLPGREDAEAAVDALLDAGIPGRAITVPADPRRAALSQAAAVRALADGRRLRAPDSLDYTVDVGEVLRVVVLDTADRTGGSGGVVSAAQVGWLRTRLAAAARAGRSVVVASHHALARSEGGEAALAVLDDSPAVVATLSGHFHRNRIEPRRTPAGGYWSIETASLVDFPQQARMLRLRETAGGGRVLETWMVDQDGAGLAGISRELAYLDAQGGRPAGWAGAPGDRNARLYLPPPG